MNIIFIQNNLFLFLAVDNKYFNKIIQFVSIEVVSNYKKTYFRNNILSAQIFSTEL